MRVHGALVEAECAEIGTKYRDGIDLRQGPHPAEMVFVEQIR